MRISSREKNITNRINSISARLTAGLSTTIHAYGQAISTAVWIASIVRKNHPSAD
jgi:DNA-binding protein